MIAHELAHSWAGNLVGNATWRDLWLNEGFTGYIESRIMTAVYGEQRSSMEAVLGLKTLRDDLAKLKPADQVLAIDLQDRDPAEAFSSIPYEKGRLFLNYLDAKFGRESFDAFLKGYFDHFAFKSVTTQQFLGYLQDNLLNRFPGIVTRDQVNAWVFGPGLPADAILPVTAMFQPVDEARMAWLAGKLQLKKLGADWVTQQWLYFLTTCLPPSPCACGSGFGFQSERQIAQLVPAGHREHQRRAPSSLFDSVGRGNLILPLYQALMTTPAGVCEARLRGSAGRIPPGSRRSSHRRSQSGVERMISEWMKVMLEEISRKKSEAEQARTEEQARAEELTRREVGQGREEPRRE